MDSKYKGILGLHTKSGFYKSVFKGEDEWLQKPATPFQSSDKGSCGGFDSGLNWQICERLISQRRWSVLSSDIVQHERLQAISKANTFYTEVSCLWCFQDRACVGYILSFCLSHVSSQSIFEVTILPAGTVKMDVFAVFDGHGGKQAATYASRNLTDKLLGLLKERTSSKAASKDPAALQELSFPEELGSESWSHWESQDQLTESLPYCLEEAFGKLQEDFFQQSKVSFDFIFAGLSFFLAGLSFSLYASIHTHFCRRNTASRRTSMSLHYILGGRVDRVDNAGRRVH